MNLVEGVQEEIKRVTAIIQEYSKYEGGQLAGCVYEKWHLWNVEFSTNVSVPFLIYAVSSSTDLNHKCSIEELNLFLFFF